MNNMHNKKLKITRLLAIAALSATILVGGKASAEELRELKRDANIEFRPFNPDIDEPQPIEVLPPDSTAPVVDIPPVVDGTTGPLTIATAPVLNFGEQVISNTLEEYSAIAESQPLIEGEGSIPYVSFAQVHDSRGSNAGWDLQVSLSEFTSNTQNNILKGAKITFKNPQIEHNGEDDKLIPSAHKGDLVLDSGEARSVMTAEQGQGAGISSVMWGNYANLKEQMDKGIELDSIENDAIKLSIPGNTPKDRTTYTAQLTWELIDSYGNPED